MNPSSSDNDVLLNELADEFARRWRQGERPALSEYIARHPELASDIREVFPALVEMELAELEPIEQESTKQDREELPDQVGDFRILGKIGRGGMGVVYEAEQLSLGRHVALKVIDEKMLKEGKHRRRFKREARAAARMHHTNIVPIFFVGEENGLPYYAMQLIRGLGLDEILVEIQRLKQQEGSTQAPVVGERRREGGKDVSAAELAHSLISGEFRQVRSRKPEESDSDEDLDATTDAAPPDWKESLARQGDTAPSNTDLLSSTMLLPGTVDSTSRNRKRTYWQSVAWLGEQAAEGLAYAHKQGVLHRDIKPSNLLLDSQGTLWITDFGLAKVSDEQNITAREDVLGTLRYMPPEAFEGKSDERSDVYALGLTLYEFLASRPAFDAQDRVRLVKQVTTAEPVRLRTLNRGVPRDLETIVHKAIERERGKRYQTAEELAEDLRRYAADEPILARRPSSLERISRWVRRNKAVASWMAVAAFLLLLGTGFSLYFAVQEGMRAESEAKARKDAEDAGNQARAERQAKEQALKRAERSQREALWNLYVARLFPMKAAWKARNLGQLEYLLKQSIPKEGEPDYRGWEWYYFQDQCQMISRKLDGNFNHQAASDWCRKTGKIALATSRKTIEIRDSSGEKIEKVLGPRQRGVTRLEWSPDGKRLACAQGQFVSVWATDSGTLLRELDAGETFGPNNGGCLAWSRDGTKLATSGNTNGAVKIWETRGWTLVRTLNANRSTRDLSWHPDNTRLACANGGRYQFVVWDTNSGKQVFSVKKSVYAAAWSPDGRFLATAEGDLFSIWDESGREVRSHRCNLNSGSIQWSPDGKSVVAGGNGQEVLIWDQDLPRPSQISAHGTIIRNISWGPDGSQVLVSGDKVVRLLAIGADLSPARVVTIGGPTGSGQVRWSKDGGQICCSHAGGISVCDSKTGTILQSFRINTTCGIAWHPDGWLVCYPPYTRRLLFWDARPPVGLKVKRVIDLQQRGGISTDWTPSGDTLAVSRNMIAIRAGRTITLWAQPSWKKIGEIKSTYTPYCVALSPNSRFLATTNSVWDVRTQKRLFGLKGVTQVMDIEWSPEGTFLIAASFTGKIAIFRAEDGKRIFESNAHKDTITAVAWSPDGHRFVTAGVDGDLIIWDAASGENLITLPCETPIHDVTWSPDSRRLACVCKDGTVRLWGSLNLEIPDANVTHLKTGIFPSLTTSKEEFHEYFTKEEAKLTTAIQADPEKYQGWRDRAFFYQEYQQWDKAIKDWEHLLSGSGHTRNTWFRSWLALCYAMTSQRKDYQEHCRIMIGFYKDAEKTSGSKWLPAIACSLIPDKTLNYETLLHVAEEGAKEDPKQSYNSVHPRAMVLYRLKRYREAFDVIQQCENAPDVGATARILQGLWSAMCQHQLGDHQQARETLKKANLLMDAELPKEGELLEPFHVLLHYVECRIIRREAEALILGNKTSESEN